VDEPAIIKFIGDNLAMVDREVVHYHYSLLHRIDSLELLNKWEEGVHGVTPKENLSKHKSMLKAQRTNHGNTLTPLVWQLDFHSFFNPHSGRLHPEVERGLVDIYNISSRFLHNYSCYPLREFLLLMHKFHLSFGLRPIDDLRFPIGGPVLNVDLPNKPSR
jgi:hypothetical protein